VPTLYLRFGEGTAVKPEEQGSLRLTSI
jgi:hypothetical protein